MIYYFTPYSSNGSIGDAYNAYCAMVPGDDDWIGLIDCDVMLFSDFGKQVEHVVRTSQYDLYTCWATRIGNPVQQYEGVMSREADLIALKRKYDQCAARAWGEVTPVQSYLSGHFLLFQKKLWKEFPFPTNSREGRMLGIDTAWTRRLLVEGKRFARMDGLLAIHYYRLGTDAADRSHLRVPSVDEPMDTAIGTPELGGQKEVPAKGGPDACLVIVPVYDRIQPECESGLRELERRGYRVVRQMVTTSIDDFRNRAVVAALEEGYAETMWIDADMQFQPSDVDKLRSHGLPITSAVYPEKGKRKLACVPLPETEKLVLGSAGKVEEIQYAGGGFMHVRREAYQQIMRSHKLPICDELKQSWGIPFFQPTIVETAGQAPKYLPEDFAFCHRARAAGISVYADTTIRIYRHGTQGSSWDDPNDGPQRYASYRFHVG